MNKNLSEIVCVLDRSGSMASIRQDAIGGFNTFLDEQKSLPGEARITLVLFDLVHRTLVDNQPIAQVEPLTEQTYIPGGSTALFDAIGDTVQSVGERLAKTPEYKRPAHIIVVILTDGEENASVRYGHSQITDMIKHQQENYNWHFVYLGVGVDAFTAARNFNMTSNYSYVNASGVNSTLNLADVSTHTGDGITGMYRSLAGTVAVLRGVGPNVTINNFIEVDKQPA